MTLVGDVVNESVSIDFDFLFIGDVGLLQENDRDGVVWGDVADDFAFWSCESFYVKLKDRRTSGSCRIDIWTRSLVDFSGIGISFPAIAVLRLYGTHRMDQSWRLPTSIPEITSFY